MFIILFTKSFSDDIILFYNGLNKGYDMISPNMIYNNLIVQAARYGMDSIGIIKHLIESCPKLLDITKGINDAFLITAELGQKDVASFLLDKGAQINYQRPQDRASAIIIAAMNNKYKFIDFLASRGANLDIQDKFGNTALLTSCNMGFVETVKPLVKHGATLNIANFQCETPLMRLINLHQKSDDMKSQIGFIMRDMIYKGADVEAKNADGVTFLDNIFLYNKSNYIEYFKEILAISAQYKMELLAKYPSSRDVINSINATGDGRFTKPALTPLSLSFEDLTDVKFDAISIGVSGSDEIQ